MIEAFILCGGLGTRFREVSNEYPKALAPIGNKLFIDSLIENLLNQNFSKIILGTGYLSTKIEKHISSNYDERVIISKENTPLGTGGALKNAITKFQTKSILVINGDTYINYQFSKLANFHYKKKADISILSKEVKNTKECGIMVTDQNNRVVEFREKVTKNNTLANVGVYIINTELLKSFKLKFSLENDLFPKICETKRVYTLTTYKEFFDIGDKEKYTKYLNSKNE